MAAKKKILLVSATIGKNYELAQELKEIIDNTTAVDTAVINLVSYDLPLYKPGIETKNETASELSAEIKNADGIVSNPRLEHKCFSLSCFLRRNSDA